MNEQIYDRIVDVVWIDTTQQNADILTEPLAKISFEGLKHRISMGGVKV